MINLDSNEHKQILNEIDDPFLASELEVIKAAQKQAEKDLATEGHTDNPYHPILETLEYRAYQTMAHYLHDPDYFKL